MISRFKVPSGMQKTMIQKCSKLSFLCSNSLQQREVFACSQGTIKQAIWDILERRSGLISRKNNNVKRSTANDSIQNKEGLSPPICCYDERSVHSCDTKQHNVWGRIKNTGLSQIHRLHSGRVPFPDENKQTSSPKHPHKTMSNIWTVKKPATYRVGVRHNSKANVIQTNKVLQNWSTR